MYQYKENVYILTDKNINNIHIPVFSRLKLYTKEKHSSKVKKSSKRRISNSFFFWFCFFQYKKN